MKDIAMDTRVTRLEEGVKNIDKTLTDIQTTVNSTKRWIMATLFGLIAGALATGIFIGSWKAGIEYRLQNLEFTTKVLEGYHQAK